MFKSICQPDTISKAQQNTFTTNDLKKIGQSGNIYSESRFDDHPLNFIKHHLAENRIQKESAMLRCFSILLLSLMLVFGAGCGTDGDRLNEPAGSPADQDKASSQLVEKPARDLAEFSTEPQVYLDIRPGSCPNNLNPRSHGKFQVALLGSADFDVHEVDVSTVMLEGVAPEKNRIKDLRGPKVDEGDCHCSSAGPDGYDDLFLSFDTAAVSEAVGDMIPGAAMNLVLAGVLRDGTFFAGEDCVEVVGKPVDSDQTGPTSPDELMQIFQTAYENMDFEALRSLLHPDFQMILQQETIEMFPDLGPTLDLNEELRIGQRMFAGLPVTDPNGDLVPGILGIAFSRFYPLDTWQLTPPDDLIPNALYAPFEVDIWFDRGQTFSTLKVQGIINFYLTYQELEVKGEELFHFQMIGQRDLTNLDKVEGTSWGTVKALFR
jgi:hypothetical protein